MLTVHQLRTALSDASVDETKEVVFLPRKTSSINTPYSTIDAHPTTVIVGPQGIAEWTGNPEDFGFATQDDMTAAGCSLKEVFDIYISF